MPALSKPKIFAQLIQTENHGAYLLAFNADAVNSKFLGMEEAFRCFKRVLRTKTVFLKVVAQLTEKLTKKQHCLTVNNEQQKQTKLKRYTMCETLSIVHAATALKKF